MSDGYAGPIGIVVQHPDRTRDDPILCESESDAWKVLLDRGFSPKVALFEAPTQLFWDTRGSGDVAWILPVETESDVGSPDE